MPQRDTGGILFLYPPKSNDDKQGPGKLCHSRVQSIHPAELHPLARWTAEENME